MRFSWYPLYKDYMQLYGDHNDEIILDYGCGPASEIVGFALYSEPKKIIGIDVSLKALRLGQHRLALHRIDPGMVELILVSDEASIIPLPDNSVDFINCLGVLMHTSHPELLLCELHRVLKPFSNCRVMVYNRDSIWMHIHAAYVIKILENRFPGLSDVEIFSKVNDGENCPEARCYYPDEFISICKEAGFKYVEYIGGHFSHAELEYIPDYLNKAMVDERFEEEHKEFLRNLQYNSNGYPKYKGKTAGFGGVYDLQK